MYMCIPYPDPSSGPGLQGWRRYDPNDKETLAILGVSPTGAIAGDHFIIDEKCEYWNQILPIYPQVSEESGVAKSY